MDNSVKFSQFEASAKAKSGGSNQAISDQRYIDLEKFLIAAVGKENYDRYPFLKFHPESAQERKRFKEKVIFAASTSGKTSLIEGLGSKNFFLDSDLIFWALTDASNFGHAFWLEPANFVSPDVDLILSALSQIIQDIVCRILSDVVIQFSDVVIVLTNMSRFTTDSIDRLTLSPDEYRFFFRTKEGFEDIFFSRQKKNGDSEQHIQKEIDRFGRYQYLTPEMLEWLKDYGNLHTLKQNEFLQDVLKSKI